MQQLFQDNPRYKSTYTLHTNRSTTDSIESYQNAARKERTILRWNGRVPTKELVLHFLVELWADDIRRLQRRIFRYLKEHGFEGVANIELTRGAYGKPNNTVHFHLLTDDKRREWELRQLLETACERQSIVKGIDFCVTCRALWDGYRYFDYFTKCDKKYSDRVILFQRGLLESGRTIQKFYTIGAWYQEDRGKVKIWQEVVAFMREKDGTAPDKPKSRFKKVKIRNAHNRRFAKTQGVCAAVSDKAAPCPPLDLAAEYAESLRATLRSEPGGNTVTDGQFEWEFMHRVDYFGSIPRFLRIYGFEVKTIDNVRQIVDGIPDPVENWRFGAE
jgi:hypothetical protein